MIARDTANGLHRVASLVGEMQGIAPPIGGVIATLNHAALLELVDQGHESAWQDAQGSREGLLADPTGGAHEPQDPGVRR